jgi:hypothetical protein
MLVLAFGTIFRLGKKRSHQTLVASESFKPKIKNFELLTLFKSISNLFAATPIIGQKWIQI